MRRWRAAWSSFALDGGASAVAFDIHLEDRGVVNEAVHRCERHDLIREDPVPFSERLV
jgi:hypothetical protein